MRTGATSVSGSGVAYAWSNHAQGESCVPQATWQFNGETGDLSSTHEWSGQFLADFPDLGRLFSNMQVTTFETTASRSVVHWLQVEGAARALVKCVDSVGEPIDSPFNILLQSN